MPIEEIIKSIALIIAGAVVNYIFVYLPNKKKLQAEIRKLEAETSKTIIEAAKLSAELAKSSQLNEGNDKEIGNVGGYDNIHIKMQGKRLDEIEDIERQINQFLKKFIVLSRELEEWKELHNVLQDLQIRFTICRNEVLDLSPTNSQIQFSNKKSALKSIERFSMNWKQCGITFKQLRDFTQGFQYIVPYDSHKQTGPELMIELDHKQHEIAVALGGSDRHKLDELSSAFSGLIYDYLYTTDKSLRTVVKRINDLPQEFNWRDKNDNPL